MENEDIKSVTINILGRTYQIKVKSGDENGLRGAESELMKLIDFFKNTYSYKDDKDLLAMSALQFAVKAMFFEKIYGSGQLNKEEKQDVLIKIKEIDNLLNLTD